MWFSQPLQEKDDTTIQNIFTEDQNLQMLQKSDLEAIHIKLQNQ